MTARRSAQTSAAPTAEVGLAGGRRASASRTQDIVLCDETPSQGRGWAVPMPSVACRPALSPSGDCDHRAQEVISKLFQARFGSRLVLSPPSPAGEGRSHTCPRPGDPPVLVAVDAVGQALSGPRVSRGRSRGLAGRPGMRAGRAGPPRWFVGPGRAGALTLVSRGQAWPRGPEGIGRQTPAAGQGRPECLVPGRSGEARDSHRLCLLVAGTLSTLRGRAKSPRGPHAAAG